MIGAQIVVDLPVDALAVIVVGVDDGKGTVDMVLCGQNGLTGAPGLAAALGKGTGDLRQRLEAVGDLYTGLGTHGLNAVADDFPEVLFDVPADNEYDLLKACGDGIMDGVIHNNMAGLIHSCKLLDSGAVAAADAGGHDHKGSLFQKYILLSFFSKTLPIPYHNFPLNATDFQKYPALCGAPRRIGCDP